MKNKWNIPHPYIIVQLLVRHEKRGIAILLIAFLMPHCPVTVVQRYGWGMQPLIPLVFHNCHTYVPDFYTCILVGLCLVYGRKGRLGYNIHQSHSQNDSGDLIRSPESF